MKQRTYSQHMKKQQGFTLLELLVVVSVLATLAGITAVAMDGYEQDSQEQLVKVEMKRIASAIYRFREDTGYFPEEGVFSDSGNDADLSWLFSSPMDGSNQEILPWSILSNRGWHGPYLELSSAEHVINNNAACIQDGAAFNTAAGNVGVLTGLTDTFERQPNVNHTTCVALWVDGEWKKEKYFGQSYLYDTDYENDNVSFCPETVATGDGCVALVSAGKDSKYNTSDDLVTVIRAK